MLQIMYVKGISQQYNIQIQRLLTLYGLESALSLHPVLYMAD